MLRFVRVPVKLLGGALIGGLFALPLAWGVDAASKKVRQPTRDDLATVWVGGCGAESLEFFRLDLNARGVGLLTVQYLPNGPVSAYKVFGTSLAGYAIALDTTPIGGAEPLQVRGEATPAALRLEVRGRAADWTRRVDLQRYDELLKRINAVSEKAAAIRAASQ